MNRRLVSSEAMADAPTNVTLETASDSGASQSAVPESVDTVIVERPRQQLYEFWRDFTNLPKFVERVVSVAPVDSLSSFWTVRDGDGGTQDWEFMVTDDDPGRLIAWSTSGHTAAKYSGRVEFKDTVPGQATEITSVVRHESPEGLVDSVKEIFSASSKLPLLTGNDLLRFKQLMELTQA